MKVMKISCMLILSFTLYAFSQVRAINLCADSSIMQREDLVKESSTHIGSVPASKSNQEYSRGILTDGFILDHCCCYYGVDPDSGYVAYPCICTDPHFPLDQFLGMHVEIWGNLQQCIGGWVTEFHVGALNVLSSDVEDDTENQSIRGFALKQNYPNPFNQTTKIEFTLAKSGFVSLNIYDILGRKARTLVSEHLSSGYKSVLWDGKNDSGKDVASGIYFYRIEVGDSSLRQAQGGEQGRTAETKKLVLLK